jgi:hypothetical protein
MAERAPRARQGKPPAGLVKKTAPRHAGGYFVFAGQEYQLADKIGIWPALQFARAAEAGWRSTDSRGLAAIHALLQDVIHPDDWGRFQEDMITGKVDDLEGLMKAVQIAMDQISTTVPAKAEPPAEETAVNGGSPHHVTAQAETG